MSRRAVVVIVAGLAAAACGGTTEPATDGPSSTTTSDTPAAQTTLRPGAPSPPPTEAPLPSKIEGRRFEVDGAVVWTRSALDTLPNAASVVRFTSTLIDSGKGLELCIGGVATSFPPQCGGPVVDDLDPSGWTQTDSGVTWGSRTVTVAWPPVDGHLTLLDDQPALAVSPIGDEQPDGLPDHCADIAAFVHRDTLSFFAADNPDRTAGGRSVNNGAIVVLAVVEEHLEDVRSELTTPDAEPCLEPVRYSTTELSAAQDRLAEEDLNWPDGPAIGSGSGNALNRVTVDVAVADGQTIALLAELFDDPEMLYVTGTAEIIEGR